MVDSNNINYGGPLLKERIKKTRTSRRLSSKEGVKNFYRKTKTKISNKF